MSHRGTSPPIHKLLLYTLLLLQEVLMLLLLEDARLLQLDHLRETKTILPWYIIESVKLTHL